MTAPPLGSNSPVTIGLVIAVLGLQGWVLKETYATRDAMRVEFVDRELFAARMNDMQRQLDTFNVRLQRMEQK